MSDPVASRQKASANAEMGLRPQPAVKLKLVEFATLRLSVAPRRREGQDRDAKAKAADLTDYDERPGRQSRHQPVEERQPRSQDAGCHKSFERVLE